MTPVSASFLIVLDASNCSICIVIVLTVASLYSKLRVSSPTQENGGDERTRPLSMVLLSDGSGGIGVGMCSSSNSNAGCGGGSVASSAAGSMRGNPLQPSTRWRERGRMSKAFSLSLPAARDQQQSFYSPSRFSTLSGDDLAHAAARAYGAGALPNEPVSLTDSFTRVNGIQNSLTAPDFGATLEFDADQVTAAVRSAACVAVFLNSLLFSRSNATFSPIAVVVT